MSTQRSEHDLAILDQIQHQILWIATNMIDVANHHRHRTDTLKVGGHQASCASMTTMMTALYMDFLNANDFVAVKPHGAPVLHAINYLLGGLDESYLSQLRHFHGLQAYPSRTKDPDRVDFSTGSVGLGPVATIFSAYTRNYIDAHFGSRDPSRFISIVGDAELDEGNIWEAVHDPGSSSLGNVCWLVDFNRQSLDRIVPDMRISPWQSAFSAHGWHVQIVKYGKKLRQAYQQPGGDYLAHWIDTMPNEHYQSLFTLDDADIRQRFCQGADPSLARFLDDYDDAQLRELVTDLGGHDLTSVLEALEESDAVSDRPSVIFFYTHKGWHLPTVGKRRNHSAVLSDEQIERLRDDNHIDSTHPWTTFSPDSDIARFLKKRSAQLKKPAVDIPPVRNIVKNTNVKIRQHGSTQEGFGHILLEFSRHPILKDLIVTTAPDVATSTNLAGWINKMGVFTSTARPEWICDPVLKWNEGPGGQHIELGISEMNFFSLLQALGSSSLYSQQRLIPIGTVYDPFICRGLDGLIYGAYSGSSFILIGTPSGVSLAPEGGAHQSTITPSLGMELPGVIMDEPAYIRPLDWLLCDACARVGASDLRSAQINYLRLSTRSIDQTPFEQACQRYGEETLHRYVLEGAYELLPSSCNDDRAPQVTIAASGAIMPEAIEAVSVLNDEGIAARLVDICSPGRLYRCWSQAGRQARENATNYHCPDVIARIAPPGSPLITVHDAASHALAWLGSATKASVSYSLGCDSFGQSGTLADLYREHSIDSEAIINAALLACSDC